MKKEVTDIQALHVELDAEDQELMGLFPARRQMAMNDILIVREGDVIYLVSKVQLARRRKMIQDIIDAGTVGVAGFVVLVQTILMVKRVVNPLRCLPWMSVVIFCGMAFRFLVNRFRKRQK